MNRTIIEHVTLLTMCEKESAINGYIVLEGGKIAAFGAGEAPAGEYGERIDGAGGYVMPGLIDMHSHVGIYGDALGFESADGNEDTDPVTPHLRALDAVNPLDRGLREALEAGVTTVCVSPGSANAIGGQIVALKTAGRRVDDMVRKQPLAVKFALGENPKSVYHEKDEAPVTRMATAALMREQLHKAQQYLLEQQHAQENADVDEPDYDLKHEALAPLLRGEIAAHFHAHRADDIFTALRIAKEFDIKPVIIHGTEAHLVADLLAQDGVPVVSGPFMTDRSKPELQNLTDGAPALLCAAGVKTAITVDHPETPLRLLLCAVAQAVKAGMGEWDGLRAVTAVPAQLSGLDDCIGTLEQGKNADVVLFDGHPLDWKTKVQAVFLDGVQQFRRAR